MMAAGSSPARGQLSLVTGAQLGSAGLSPAKASLVVTSRCGSVDSSPMLGWAHLSSLVAWRGSADSSPLLGQWAHLSWVGSAGLLPALERVHLPPGTDH